MCADMTAQVAFRKVLKTSDKKARFPGFHQRTRIHRAGSTVRNGARPLTVDIELRESTPMQLPDGTKLYCDVFLPAVSAKEELIPALIAWYVMHEPLWGEFAKVADVVKESIWQTRRDDEAR